MDLVGSARSRVALLTSTPAGWAGDVVGGVAPAGLPAQFERWMRTDQRQADRLVWELTELAQQRDEDAPLVLIAMLGSGLRAVARHTSVPVDEVVGEFLVEIYSFDLERRARACNVLMRVKQRLVRRWQREQRWDAYMAADVPADTVGVVDELIELLGIDGLSGEERDVLFRMRVVGESAAEVAAATGRSRWAVYKQCERAEARLVELARAELAENLAA